MNLSAKPWLFIWLLLIPALSKAQVAPEVARKYPPNITARIYEVAAKVKLSIKKQEVLGAYFKSQDSLAQIAIIKRAPAEEINNYYATRPEDLRRILSPFELNDYSIKKDNTASKFAVALKYRDELGLVKVQTDSLFQQIELVKTGKKMAGAEIKKYEADHLIKILKDEQYKSLLFIINKEKSSLYASDTWQRAKELGLTTGLDSVKGTQEIALYQDNKVTSDEYFNTAEKVASNNANVKPLLLQKVDVYNGNAPEKILSALIKYHAELNLTAKEVNDVIDYVLELENWRASMLVKNPNSSADTKKNELITLRRMLKTDELYTRFLILKNTGQANKYAKADWLGLIKYNLLTADADTAKLKAQIVKYQLDILVTVEKLSYSDPAKIDSIKKVFSANRPPILFSLAAYTNKLPKSQFADVIGLRDKITLENKQFDQCLELVKKLELLKLNNIARQLNEYTGAKEFESENIRKLLSPQQYDFYIFYKVQPKVVTIVSKDWDRLKQNGLAKGLDSVKTKRLIFDYEQRWLVANEKYLNDKSQENAFTRKNIEDNKPDPLKNLDATLKAVQANNNTKKSLTW